MRATRRKEEIPFAAIPSLFGLQQIVEGVPWLSFKFDAPRLNVAMIDFHVTTEVATNIVHVSPHFYKLPVMFLYVAATCVSCFMSGDATIRLFGAPALLLFGVTYAFFVNALFSVWCFFAAILSSIIYVHFILAAPQPDVVPADR